MKETVEIKPASDGDGFCLHFAEAAPVWFSLEHHAISHAQEMYPWCEIVVFAGKDIIKERYQPRTQRE